MHYDCLYLSPHLDDVVLSCAGQILQQARQGLTVMVASVFTHGGSDPHVEQRYDHRRTEDTCALAVLGANYRWLGYDDAPVRDPYYCSFETLLLKNNPADSSLSESLSIAVKALFEEIEPSLIYLPLGAGTHVDHCLTHNVWAKLADQAPVAFYEDRPYCFLAHSVGIRLAEIGAQVDGDKNIADLFPALPTPVRREHLLESLWRVHFAQSFLESPSERFRAALCLARKLDLPPAPPRLCMRPSVVTPTPSDVERICQAASAYTSQFGALYGDEKTLREEALSYCRFIGVKAPYAERYWHLQSWCAAAQMF